MTTSKAAGKVARPWQRVVMARRIIGILVVLLVIAAIGVMTAGNRLLTRSVMDEASLQAESALRLAAAALSGHLKRYEPLPALIADDPDMKELVRRPDDAGLRAHANVYLKAINALLKSSDIYIMTMDGVTIAASNYDGPASFVGENFSYRPYFQEAAAGRQSRFYALGTTSAKRGYYFASPIHVDGAVGGVGAITGVGARGLFGDHRTGGGARAAAGAVFGAAVAAFPAHARPGP